MANKFNPIGGKAINTIVGATYNSKSHKYFIPASDSNDIFVNEFVKITQTATSDGIPIITKAAPGDKLIGIVEAIKSIHEFNDFIYRKAGEARVIWVKDDPWLELEVQASGVVTTTDIGKSADIVVGAGIPTTGISGSQLDVATITPDSAQLKILGIVEREKNILGEYTHLRCIIAEHELKDIPTYEENLWDRTGTTIEPHTSGDDLDMGTGDITANDVQVNGKLTVVGLIDPTALLLDPQAVAPATDDGTIYYDSVTNEFKLRENGAWKALSGTDEFKELIDTPSSYTTINAIYTVTDAKDGVKETTVTLDDSVANTITYAKGTTTVTLSATSTIDQDLQQSASPTFVGQTLSGLNVADGIVQTDGAGTLTSSITLPNGTLTTTQSPSDNSTKVATTAYADAAIQGGVNEDQIYYRRTGGSDSKDGKNIADAFLTYSFAFTTVAGQTPTVNNQFTVVALDGGVYSGTFDMTSTPWTIVDAVGTTVKVNDAIIQDNCVINLKQLERLSGVGNVMSKIGTGTSYLNVEIIRNTIATGGGLAINGSGGSPIWHIRGKELTVSNRTETLFTNMGVAATTYIKEDYTRGKLFTTQVGDKLYVNGDYIDSDFSLNANSELYLTAQNWSGNIVASGALTKIYLNGGAARSNLSGSTLNAAALVYKNGKTFRRYAVGAANYSPSILTDHRIIAFTDVSVSRTATISTEDIQDASPDSPRYCTVKDESGQASPTQTITVVLESGSLDVPIVIAAPYNSVDFYFDGTNAHIV